MQRQRKNGYAPAAAFLNAYLGLDDKEQSFTWLERAVEERSNLLMLLKMHLVRFTLQQPPVCRVFAASEPRTRGGQKAVPLLRRTRKESLTLFLRDRGLPSWSGTRGYFSWLCPNGLRNTRASTARSKSFRESRWNRDWTRAYWWYGHRIG